MSYPPQELLDVREYVHVQSGVPYTSLGIVGNLAHTTGYHLGKDRLLAGDYSNAHPRDRAGLTNAASALDIGWFGRLVQLTAWMVTEARAGRRPDTREIIGPHTDGRAYRWAREGGWKAEARVRGDSHETHTHESYYRDSENRDKIQYFRGFFEPDQEDADMSIAYKVVSSDPAFNGNIYVSDRISRRELRAPGGIQTPARSGLTTVTLTDAMRTSVGPTETWPKYLDAVAGPLVSSSSGLTDADRAKLDAILAAALDDDDITVVLDGEARAALIDIRDRVAATPAQTATEIRKIFTDAGTP